jgi:DNA ligase-1
MEPQLAVNYIEARVKEHLRQGATLWAEPKLDGVRGAQYTPGQFTGRSLEPFANRRLTKIWSHPDFQHLDGELILLGEAWNYPRLCSEVTSLTNTIEGHPRDSALVAFDWLEDLSLPYWRRYRKLEKRVSQLEQHYAGRIQIMPFVEIRDWDQLLEHDTNWVDNEKLEGTIIRDHNLPGKPGRSSKVEIHLWRIKRFIDFEVKVTRFDAALENRNEQKVNALGRKERSTHKANKHPKEMVGTVYGVVLKDVKHEGKVLFKKGMEIAIGPGRLTHDFRKLAYHKPELLVGQILKVKTLPYGVKDKPRMPTAETLRSLADM